MSSRIRAERKAAEIRIRAERKAGKLLAEIERSKPGPRPGQKDKESDSPYLLDDQDETPYQQAKREAHISDYQAKRWQQLAAIAHGDFEGRLHDLLVVSTASLNSQCGSARSNVCSDALPSESKVDVLRFPLGTPIGPMPFAPGALGISRRLSLARLSLFIGFVERFVTSDNLFGAGSARI
jgi:hypothetical protein